MYRFSGLAILIKLMAGYCVAFSVFSLVEWDERSGWGLVPGMLLALAATVAMNIVLDSMVFHDEGD